VRRMGRFRQRFLAIGLESNFGSRTADDPKVQSVKGSSRETIGETSENSSQMEYARTIDPEKRLS
jgi:hypothetical protein